ncbi:4-(cytidine 5'-diphospho)-2-C-methyl-D-erythritol kinase [Pseudolabrys taiwanensis]|uniref:4-diphosphocytidyl-2-C-methyl-D-erythritol kinase n=1 Tax=Pseudolabrys taiwanensis TaxID=331696 RepID=A0A346A4W4_9HYPH|nr:4-(cytidine 5'-diphospho)-2-C-methyl-D-erythritol kinase [Pseudolabrys taiwanensis]AXK84211.1 4-(cytidine 5'-diphospho)-2-C-methyl-D-erythritol kinase [Pseudolabrys taiwanensis]
MTSLVEQAPAKINLTLRIVGRRADGYHLLESLVVFATVGDKVRLEPGVPLGLDISGPYAGACGRAADNLVLKAVAALSERVPGLKAGHFHLEKNLPVAAGIGGGSSDAAAALRLLARANGVLADDPHLAAAALAVGADVPVCLDPRPRIMRGIGEDLSEALWLPELFGVLVNPGVPLTTRDVFAKLSLERTSKKPLTAPPNWSEGVIDYLTAHGNDLTEAAVACAPAVGEVLATLAALPGVLLARMSGSGSTCFALLPTAAEAAAVAAQLRSEHPRWWVADTVFG